MDWPPPIRTEDRISNFSANQIHVKMMDMVGRLSSADMRKVEQAIRVQLALNL
jgi:hypothetical protein